MSDRQEDNRSLRSRLGNAPVSVSPAPDPRPPAPDKFHDECGVVAIYGHPEAANLTYLGLYALQHRGQESAGIASSDGREIRCYKSMGHVADIFTPQAIASLPGNMAIGHTRYSTAGDTAL